MNEQQVRAIVQQMMQQSQYSVAKVPLHIHNGVDSPFLPNQILSGSGAPTGRAAKGTLYVNTTASTTTTRLYINTNGGSTWAYFTASA